MAATTGTLVPVLYQTVLDSNGKPVAGAKIATYLAGTSTPTPTYTDVTLTVPSANPITADSAGRWSAYLVPGAGYKFVIQDATGTPGVADGAVIRTIDNVVGPPIVTNPTTLVSTLDGRLTVMAGTPVPTSDVLGATTVYFTPYKGNKIALYDGVTWNLFTFSELALPLAGFAADTNFDVFATGTGAAVSLAATSWTNATTRATGLVVQDGVLVQAGTPTRRYLATIRTTGTIGQTEDSTAKRYVWNYYHRLRRLLLRLEPTASWTYTTATWRQVRADPANQVDLVIGVAEVLVKVLAAHLASNSGVTVPVQTGLGRDSVTAPVSGQIGIGDIASATLQNQGKLLASLEEYPAIGRHYYAWLERSTAVGTTTWYGTNGDATLMQSGLSGWVEG